LAIPLGAVGHVITIYSPKGGAGCTTLATNLAVSLNNEDTSVILVDGNLQFGDVAVFLNEQGKFSVADLAPRADELDPDIVDNVTIKHSQSGVRILAAPNKPEQGDNVTGEQFSKVLRYLRNIYSYVIVDTTSALNNITVGAIDSSDLLILLTTQDIPSIKSSRLFLDVIDALGYDRKRIVFVMNKFDKRIGITPEKVSENLKQEVAAVVPFEERVIVSVNRGIPFLLVDKSRPLSRAILSLAEIVRQRISETESQSDIIASLKSTGKK
jgi:pilus assembly protein CpaE